MRLLRSLRRRYDRAVRFSFLFSLWCLSAALATNPTPPVALVIHGGAGTILKKNMTPEKEAAYTTALREALEHGMSLLESGKPAIEVVSQVIVLMEDAPLFNAGKGSVLTHKGGFSLDASIMTGHDLQAGCVAGVTTVRNPILLARAVLERSPHVFLSGAGAEQFAQSLGFKPVDPKWFRTERRVQEWRDQLAKEKQQGRRPMPVKFGTVGVVALDAAGNLCAGTSTGGITNKKFGRIGDSPIIGAGTYADNKSCAVSATGQGEYFIRAHVAGDIAARVAYRGETIQQAADAVIHKKLTELGGTGGVIVLDRNGRAAYSFNTAGMYRGYYRSGEKPEVAIYGEKVTAKSK
ncbi:isoaspartyl peptidase/L-asparaginase family protein [Acanthopleuribacter pedis]|uniref:Isoaspartyl peptidase n=1 Tax=Acanthopleuribacter pedis TaxID=442870 RepID=A0A8J7Q3X2_9BACT|nr:isoaspartyl peptidase/L-asparaginase [Acanthopleuribacter pedis]MBO1318780.1 isoaspartyl peptidase/L-asparaginase [Acanthopleuribacter pedis]